VKKNPRHDLKTFFQSRLSGRSCHEILGLSLSKRPAASGFSSGGLSLSGLIPTAHCRFLERYGAEQVSASGRNCHGICPPFLPYDHLPVYTFKAKLKVPKLPIMPF
jgi:hypothetical protein